MKPIIHPIWFYLLDVGQSLGDTLMCFGVLFSIAGAIIYFICAVAAAENDDIPKQFSRLKGFLWIGVFVCVISGLIPSKETGYAMMAANIVTPNNIEAAGDTATDIIDYIVDSVDKLIEDNENEGD